MFSVLHVMTILSYVTKGNVFDVIQQNQGNHKDPASEVPKENEFFNISKKYIWVFPKIEIPKWMVYNGKPY